MSIRKLIVAVVVVGGLLVARSIGLLESSASQEAAASATNATVAQHENLNATLWVQTSAEYVGSALQAYAAATAMLERGLEDPGWSASLEQQAAGGYELLPPAVILDVDETVLDNGANQARQILDRKEFNRADWHAWVREEQAPPVPGALEFTRHAAQLGVTVFYVTNRRHEVESATRNNLAAHGFPLSDDIDTILTRDERPGWGGDKGTRRQEVGASYRIVLLVGDNLGDFVSDINQSAAARDQMTRPYAEYWGRRWIVLPNPQYGSWDGALINFEYSLPTDEKGRLKASALDPKR